MKEGEDRRNKRGVVNGYYQSMRIQHELHLVFHNVYDGLDGYALGAFLGVRPPKDTNLLGNYDYSRCKSVPWADTR